MRSTAILVGGATPSAPPPSPESPATFAAAELGVWLDSPAAFDVAAAAGIAPAVATPAIQASF